MAPFAEASSGQALAEQEKKFQACAAGDPERTLSA